MLTTNDEERIKQTDRVLVVIPNQYMLLQTIWYHSRYPEGIWEAIVVPYGRGELGKRTQEALYRECEKSGIFSKIIQNDELRVGESRLRRVRQFVEYLGQCLTHRRGMYDFQMIRRIMGHCNYKKVLVHPSNMMCTAAINAARKARGDAVLICMEDGLADYGRPVGFFQLGKIGTPFHFIFYYILSKMNVFNNNSYGVLKMEYDKDIIKYVHFPERMQYRNFKRIKQLNEEKKIETVSQYINKKSQEKKYDLIVFSAPLIEDFSGSILSRRDDVYIELHELLKKNYTGRKILIKPHPREHYDFLWNDLDVEVGEANLAGEEILDRYPKTEVIFVFTSTMLIKVLQENRPFKVIYFRNIKDKSYKKRIKEYSDLLGMNEQYFIMLGKR